MKLFINRKKHIKLLTLLILGIILMPIFACPVFAEDMKINNNVLIKYRTDNGIKSVTIPAGVTAIANEAFSSDTSLEEIIIPSTVRIIGDRAFYNCNSLKRIDIPSGVTTIGESAFSHCSSATEASIPATVTSIGNGIFAGATSLTKISVSGKNPCFFANDGVLYSKDSTKLIQYGAGKTGEVYDMPFTVKEVAPYAFWGADNLKAIYVSNNVEDILPLSFANAKGLEAVFLPNSVGSVQQYAFRGDYNLRLVGVEQDKIDVHPSAFDECPRNLELTKVSANIDLIKTAELIKLEVISGNRTIRSKVISKADSEAAANTKGSGSKEASKAEAGESISVNSKTSTVSEENAPSDNKASKTKKKKKKKSSSANTANSSGSSDVYIPNGYAYVDGSGTGRVYNSGTTVGIGRVNSNWVYITPVP